MGGSAVLAVDDDRDIRDVVADALRDEGYRVETARDGAEAVATVERRRPALVLPDMRVAVLDGWGFAEAYGQGPDPRAPVVVMTAAADARVRAAEVEAAGVLAKPFALDDLRGAVGRPRARARAGGRPC